MEVPAVVALLRDLVHLDVDAIHAYDQAIKNVDVAHVKAELDRFKADHERHVSDLSAAIVDLRGRAPVIRRDVKGFFIQGMTALRAAMGSEQSLRAMLTDERLTNREYDKAARMTLPPRDHPARRAPSERRAAAPRVRRGRDRAPRLADRAARMSEARAPRRRGESEGTGRRPHAARTSA